MYGLWRGQQLLRWEPGTAWAGRDCAALTLASALKGFWAYGMRRMGCRWDEKACMWAAKEGHLEALQYLRTGDGGVLYSSSGAASDLRPPPWWCGACGGACGGA